MPILSLTPSIGAKAWVLVPVFNGGDCLRACLTSLMRELKATPGVEALVIDDASTDPIAAQILDEVAGFPRLHLHYNTTNFGFVSTINIGLQALGSGPVLLLNSDTYLPPGTLARLLAHLNDPEIATVTPLSNNAGSFSVPMANTAFKAPSKQQADALARRAARLFQGQSIDVLNGNGFCMLISANARETVGQLSTAYESGYYEEVDFCLRASQKGLRHLAAVDCFVSHIGGMSFEGRKANLVARNQKELYRRFPFYPNAYRRYQAIDPLSPFRNELMSGVKWQPIKRAEPCATVPEIDFHHFDRPLALFSQNLSFAHVAGLFPELRPCPMSWADKFMVDPSIVPFAIRQRGNHFDLVNKEGVIVSTKDSAVYDGKTASAHEV